MKKIIALLMTLVLLISAVALPALRHRVTLSFEALAEGITTDQIVKKIVSSIPKE